MAQKAPGKSHREGISLIELFGRFPDDAAAEQWFEEQRWGAAGKPSHCPMCGGTEKVRPFLPASLCPTGAANAGAISASRLAP